MDNRKTDTPRQTAEQSRDNTPRVCPPCHAAEPERLPRHKKTPGDRAIDVLDNHTPDIDL